MSGFGRTILFAEELRGTVSPYAFLGFCLLYGIGGDDYE